MPNIVVDNAQHRDCVCERGEDFKCSNVSQEVSLTSIDTFYTVWYTPFYPMSDYKRRSSSSNIFLNS